MSNSSSMTPALEAAWAVYNRADARVRTAPLSTWSKPSYRALVAKRGAAAAQIKTRGGRTMSAIWSEIVLAGGIVQHVRIPLSVVVVTPEQALLGLGA